MPMLPESLTFLQAVGGLQAFPEQALALQQLAYLHLAENCFTVLPAGLTVLSNLQYLALGLSRPGSRIGLRNPGNMDAVALGDLSAFPA